MTVFCSFFLFVLFCIHFHSSIHCLMQFYPEWIKCTHKVHHLNCWNRFIAFFCSHHISLILKIISILCNNDNSNEFHLIHFNILFERNSSFFFLLYLSHFPTNWMHTISRSIFFSVMVKMCYCLLYIVLTDFMFNIWSRAFDSSITLQCVTLCSHFS